MSQSHYARIAEFYDTFVQTDYDVAFFTQEAQQVNAPVLELMAGTGRLSIPLLQAGINLTCVDYSAPMLALLREKLDQHGLTADVHQMDVRHLHLNQRFQQIILPFQAFPELTTKADQAQALRSIADHLADDGVFICTLHNPTVRLRYVDNQLHLVGQHPLSDDDQLHIWLLQRHNPQTMVVEVLEFFEEYDAQGVLQRKHFSPLQFHLITQAQFEALVDEAGLTVVECYGDYAYAPFAAESSPFMIYKLGHPR